MDFTACLRANKVSKALQVTDQALRSFGHESTEKSDVAVRTRLEQEFSQLPKEELELVLGVCGQAVSDVGFHIAPPLVISGIEILDEHPKAKGLLVDLDDLKVSWRADGPPEDILVLLEGMETARRTAEHVVSSSEESLIIQREELAPLLLYRERSKSNRIRAVLKTKSGRITSRDFPLAVGIKLTVLGAPEKIKVMARIDNSPIDFYDFEAKVVIPFKRKVEFLTLDGFLYGKNDRPINQAESLAWNDIRVVYFGPDDPRLIRPEFVGLATGGR